MKTLYLAMICNPVGWREASTKATGKQMRRKEAPLREHWYPMATLESNLHKASSGKIHNLKDTFCLFF